MGDDKDRMGGRSAAKHKLLDRTDRGDDSDERVSYSSDSAEVSSHSSQYTTEGEDADTGILGGRMTALT